jgi:hypothetical protein
MPELAAGKFNSGWRGWFSLPRFSRVFPAALKELLRANREVSLWPDREAPIAISYKCRNWRPGSSIPAGGDGFLSPAFPASFPPLSRNFYGPIEKSRYRPTAKHRLRSPMNAGIGGREVQFRLEGTKGVERMSSGAMGWRVSLTEDNTRVYPRARGTADRADGPYRKRLPATSRTSINSWVSRPSPFLWYSLEGPFLLGLTRHPLRLKRPSSVAAGGLPWSAPGRKS